VRLAGVQARDDDEDEIGTARTRMSRWCKDELVQMHAPDHLARSIGTGR
jgi:hypothetical protein